jgi:hypothetical protein
LVFAHQLTHLLHDELVAGRDRPAALREPIPGVLVGSAGTCITPSSVTLFMTMTLFISHSPSAGAEVLP